MQQPAVRRVAIVRREQCRPEDENSDGATAASGQRLERSRPRQRRNDVALSIVRAGSPALADLTARYLVVDERPSQAPYIMPSALAQADPAVAAFERWVRDDLADPITIPAAAKAIGVSQRTLQRAVQRTTGTSPIRFIQDLRVELARHLLRTTDLSVETISRKVGYENPHTLRVLLRERTGKTASALRGRRDGTPGTPAGRPES